MLTKTEVLSYFESKRNISWFKRDKRYLDWLLDNFTDLSSTDLKSMYIEALYLLKHDLTERPVCENCGKKLSFLGKFYESGCYKECKKILAKKRLSETSLKKYGVTHPTKSDIVKYNQEQTNIKKYGCKSALCNDKVNEKSKTTLINKYGKDNIAKTDYWKEKVIKTSNKKYGCDYPNQSEIVKEKIKQTCVKHFGVDNFYKTEYAKNKCLSKEIRNQINETKRKNGTFNTSIPEKKSFELLKRKFADTISQYRDERYPFNCDFYIPSLDLFIECQYSWTHGDHPYNIELDTEKLNSWKSKNSQYYKNAITTWTIRDVNKRETAKKNNLNFFEFFSLQELENWLNNFKTDIET